MKISHGPHGGHTAQEAPPIFQEMQGKPTTEAWPERTARGFDIYKRDTEKYGFTSEGCPKCGRAMRHGWDAAKQHSHSKLCRQRFEKAFRGSSEDKHRVEEADRRQDRWLAEQVRVADQPANGGVDNVPPASPGTPPQAIPA